MDISGIISVSGMSGLYKVVAQSRNGIIVESLADNKRMPIYASHKVSALEDISIYSVGDDVPLTEVLKKIKEKQNSSAIAVNAKTDNKEVKSLFKESFPEHDEERVFVSDMKKVFTWYNILLEKGFLDKEPEGKQDKTAEVIAEKPVAKPKTNAAAQPKTAAPKASTKGMSKPTTVRKTGG
ncbi:MAG: DUF5606 domain-containing protein [Flavobacteriales bacterium]